MQAPSPLPHTERSTTEENTGPLSPWVILFALLVAVALDLFKLHHGLIKLEIDNTIAMEVFVALREGWWVLSSDPSAFGEAPAYWPFQLLFLLTPSPESLAPLLALMHLGFTAVVGRQVGLRFGKGMGWSYAALHLSMPLYWALSTHLIPSYLTPLFAPLYFLSLYDLMQPNPSQGAERRAWWLGAALVLVHRGNLVYLPCLLLVQLLIRRRPSWVTLLGFAALLTPTLHRLSRDGFEASMALDGHAYDSLWEFTQRLVFLEDGMQNDIVAAWGLYGLLAFAAAWLLIRRPAPARPFLLGLLSLPLLWFPQPAALISAEFLLLLALLLVAQRVRWFRWLLHAYVLGFVSHRALMLFMMAPLPHVHFLSLSSTASRDLMFDGLINQLHVTADEMETVSFESEFFEKVNIIIPATQPGTSYYVDQLMDPLPAGGDRCVLIADETQPPPDHGPSTQTLHHAPWRITTWRQQGPCPGTLRLDRGRPVFVDLSTWTLTTFPETTLP